MSRDARRVVDRFEELLDRDIETLLTGGTPVNTDLIPLQDVVEQLRSLADVPVSDEFIAFHASESAAAVARSRTGGTGPSQTRGATLLHVFRRRATAAAATLVMMLSATGMAWAADGAVPGDWYYGIDRALEFVGIGAGGTAERLQELEATTPKSPGETSLAPIDDPGPTSPEPTEGTPDPDPAPAVVSQDQPSGLTFDEHEGPAERVLAYLDSTEHVDGAIVSALARGDRLQGEAPGNGRQGPPDETGRANQPGPSDRGEERSNGASRGEGGRPEAPGRSEKPARP